MSREIKGRSWDGRRMIYWDTLQIDFFPDQTPVICFKNETFNGTVRMVEHKDMLYSGLKDYTVLENEIYEGDILLCNEQDEHLEVFYSDGAFRIQFSFEDESTVLTEKIIKANWLRNAGNIYENPELLED